MSNYLDGLNPQQKEAVLTTDGPMMILAGAGSGKTKTLISKIVHLLKTKDVQPWEILAVTFSNRAAKEMRERIHKELPEIASTSIQLSTFHAFCARVLRMQSAAIGLKSSFSIYDDSESTAVAKAILKRHDIDPKQINASGLLHFIDQLKNQGYYLNRPNFKLRKDVPLDKHWPYFEEYEKELANNNAVDFGSLITKVLELFENHPQILDYYTRKYKYLLVDEYQDTNRSQFDLIKLLASKHNNLCVVGDSDQSIYSWRGAEIRNILDFEKVYPNAKILKLEENYRSSKNIIEAATEMIKKNMYRKEKNMFTNNIQGEKIKVFECVDGLREAQYVAQCINNLLKKKVSPKEIAVFYRTNAQSRGLEDGLRRLMIPYQIIGGLKFYERKEVKDVVAYLQVMMNPFDEISLLRVINTPARGIGDKTISSLIENSRSAGLNLFDYLKITIQKNPKSLGGAKAIAGITKFVELIAKGQQMNLNGDSPSDIFEHIMDETGYIDILKASNKYEDQARIENLQELKSSIIQFLATSEDKTLTAYLETITLDRTEDNLDYGKVSLMTIHSSKGLEFDYVFVVGLEETMFPSGQSLGEGIERLEEERRLFYVSVTRARKELSLLYANSRLLYGKLVNNPPSRFISELPKSYISRFRV